MKIYELCMIVILTSFIMSESYAGDSQIGYLAHTQGYWQVWVMQSDGSEKRQITTSAYDKTHISWYPDGIHLLVNGAQGHIRRINTQDNSEEAIELPIKGTVDAVISPDGNKIAFSLTVAGSRDNNHIWVVDSNGGNLVKLTNMGGLQHEPVWSPDGKWVYFLSGNGQANHDIWRVGLHTKAIEQITVNQLYNFDLALSQAGRMAISSNRVDNYEIWAEQKSGSMYRVTHHEAMDSRPTWSPDGEEIIYESSRNGVMNIWRMPVKGGEILQLTNEKIGARYPVWSPRQVPGDI